MRMGLDFDNTLAGYDAVFAAAAREGGLVGPEFSGTKRDVREAVWRLDDGEFLWRRLQGRVYGALMSGAELFEGAGDFLLACRRESVPVFIVSHKTIHGHHDPTRVDLRQAALAWMEAHGFFDPAGFAVPMANVFFENSRAEKLERIAQIGCTRFVDDLVELFQENDFPKGVERMLFHPAPGSLPKGPFQAFASWRDIERACFGKLG